MDIWSEFIHEEIFVLKEITGADQPEIEPQVAQSILGVIGRSGSPEEEELLKGILNATKLNASTIIRKNSLDASAKTWLIFNEEIEIDGELHFPMKKFKIADSVLILAYPLSRLRSSQNEKAELWGHLKAHFNL